jgi:hypothetical protein
VNLGPHPAERATDHQKNIAAGAVLAGPALIVAAAASIFLPLGQYEILLAILLLGQGPAALSLAWLPGGSRGRARSATVITAAMAGLAVGLVGLQANPCVADPTTVGIMGAVMAIATVLVATAVGRMLALEGRVVAPFLAAGVVGIAGFIGTAFVVLPKVLVLC